MKAKKKGQSDPYALNKQLEGAFIWLRNNKYIKTATDLAAAWKLSKATVSEYLSMKRRLGIENATKFDNLVLKRHKLTLEAFRTDILNKQARLAHRPSSQDIASLTTTQLVRIEASQDLTLDKLAEMEKQIGELRDLVTKMFAIVAP